MMTSATIQATLLTDGSSDRALLPILRWLIERTLHHLSREDLRVALEWAELRDLRKPPKKLPDKLKAAVNLSPCQLLFIHRDAEAQDPGDRRAEIERAHLAASLSLPYVCVIPVRMQEAWLLHDEAAIRSAAGRPSSTIALHLPQDPEAIPNPKEALHTALCKASGLSGKRLKDFNPHRAVHRVSDLIRDWSPLHKLRAFQALEHDVQATLQTWPLAAHPPASR